MLPNSLLTIEDYAFTSCARLESISLPDSIKTIGVAVFSYCESLKEIELPSKLKKVESGLFLNCSSLKTLIIPDSVEEIECNALDGCSSLREFKVANNNKKYLCLDNRGLYNKKKTIFYKLLTKEVDTYMLLDGIKKITANSFEGCLLKSIIIPVAVNQ